MATAPPFSALDSWDVALRIWFHSNQPDALPPLSLPAPTDQGEADGPGGRDY